MRMENTVFSQISNIGLDVYLPKYKKNISHARKIIEKIYPLFPRYLFVKSFNNETFLKIKNLRGVSDYLKNKIGYPHFIKDDTIRNLKNRENSDGFINQDNFYKGQNILIGKGKIRNFQGSFLSNICKDNAKVLVELLGREHCIIAPRDSLDLIN